MNVFGLPLAKETIPAKLRKMCKIKAGHARRVKSTDRRKQSDQEICSGRQIANSWRRRAINGSWTNQ